MAEVLAETQCGPVSSSESMQPTDLGTRLGQALVIVQHGNGVVEQEQVRVAGEVGGDSDSRASRQPAARPGQSSVQSTALWISAPPYCAEGRYQLLATRNPTWTHLHQPMWYSVLPRRHTSRGEE